MGTTIIRLTRVSNVSYTNLRTQTEYTLLVKIGFDPTLSIEDSEEVRV